MTIDADAGRWLATLLLRHAAGRLRRRRPEWADAMVSETAGLASVGDQLRWAAGCAVASYRAPGGMAWAAYPLVLSLCVVVMTAYQWSADESLRTLLLVALLSVALGLFRPGCFLVSGVAVGLVVAGVNIFETISGVRPAYEATAHSLSHDVRWAFLLAPALIAASIGGGVGKSLKPR